MVWGFDRHEPMLLLKHCVIKRDPRYALRPLANAERGYGFETHVFECADSLCWEEVCKPSK